MRIAVVTCEAYEDAVPGFTGLLDELWPDCPYMGEVLVDHSGSPAGWCKTVADFAAQCKEPVLLCQEDFFINAPVNQYLIERALEQMQLRKAAMVRLYPCPGADEDYGDEHFGRIRKGTPYRVSCQMSIWNPKILAEIAGQLRTPSEFEIVGSKLSDLYDEEFLSFKREVQPWPVSYLCSAISRGLWNPDAKKLCDLHGVEVDWSRRGFAAA